MRLWIVLSILWAVPMSVLGVGVALTWHIYQPPKMVPWQITCPGRQVEYWLPQGDSGSDVRCSHFPTQTQELSTRAWTPRSLPQRT